MLVKEKKKPTSKNWQEWASVILLLIGASLLALNISETKWAFPIMGMARIWISILMWRKKDFPMFAMNFFYVPDSMKIHLITIITLYKRF